MSSGQNYGFGEQSGSWENSDSLSKTWEISIAKAEQGGKLKNPRGLESKECICYVLLGWLYKKGGNSLGKGILFLKKKSRKFSSFFIFFPILTYFSQFCSFAHLHSHQLVLSSHSHGLQHLLQNCG